MQIHDLNFRSSKSRISWNAFLTKCPSTQSQELLLYTILHGLLHLTWSELAGPEQVKVVLQYFALAFSKGIGTLHFFYFTPFILFKVFIFFEP